VRGYDYLSLGVKQGDAVLPGRRLLVGSTEYTQWIRRKLGHRRIRRRRRRLGRQYLFKAKVGYGAGPRVRTPIGPIRLDIAYGQAVSSWRLHFSVGFTF
jgi:translocation and assembly module TamA